MGNFALGVAGPGDDGAGLQMQGRDGAACVSQRPLAAAGGQYNWSSSETLVALPAGRSLVSAQWLEAKYLFVLLRLEVRLRLFTAPAAAQMYDFDLVRVTGMTTPDTGSNAIVSVIPKRRTFGPSRLNSLLIGNITNGVGVADVTPVRFVADGPPNITSPTAAVGITVPPLVLYDAREAGGAPLELVEGEGLRLRAVSAFGAGGAFKLVFTMEWAEVAVL